MCPDAAAEGAAAAAAASARRPLRRDDLLGLRVSVVSAASAVRLEGVVCLADLEEGEIHLGEVMCRGTEDREWAPRKVSAKRHPLDKLLLVRKRDLAQMDILSGDDTDGEADEEEYEGVEHDEDEDVDHESDLRRQEEVRQALRDRLRQDTECEQDQEETDKGAEKRQPALSVDDSGFASAAGSGGSNCSSPPPPPPPAPSQPPAPDDPVKGAAAVPVPGDEEDKSVGALDLRSMAEALKNMVCLGAKAEEALMREKARELPWAVPLAMTKRMVQKKPKLFPDYRVPEELARFVAALCIFFSPFLIVLILFVWSRLFERGDLSQQDPLLMSDEDSRVFRAVRELLETGMTANNYKEYLSLLLYAEEHQAEKDMESYDMYSQKLRREPREGAMYLRVAGLVDRSPNVLKGDLVCAYVSGGWYDLEVEETYQDKVYFKRDQSAEKEIFLNGKVSKSNGSFIIVI